MQHIEHMQASWWHLVQECIHDKKGAQVTLAQNRATSICMCHLSRVCKDMTLTHRAGIDGTQFARYMLLLRNIKMPCTMGKSTH